MKKSLLTEVTLEVSKAYQEARKKLKADLGKQPPYMTVKKGGK